LALNRSYYTLFEQTKLVKEEKRKSAIARRADLCTVSRKRDYGMYRVINRRFVLENWFLFFLKMDAASTVGDLCGYGRMKTDEEA